jgi:hypothetical protein
MNFSLGSPIMLWGLLGISIPLIIHLLSRRRATTIDWGAMQFLDIGRRAQRKFQITELLLMAGRMLILAIVALALTRPLWEPKSSNALAGLVSSKVEPRDYVLILDGSESMGRKVGGTTPRDLALNWSKSFTSGLKPGDSVTVLLAKDRVKPLTDGPSYDSTKIAEILKKSPPPRGSSDLPSAIAEAFRVLGTTKNTSTEIVILSDGQRHAWRPGESARWALLRDLHKGLRTRAPRISAVSFASGKEADGPDVSVAPIEMSRGVYPPNASIEVVTSAANSGPGPASRIAELLIDGVPVAGSSRAIGPIPAGGKTPLTFRATVAASGSHLIAVKLSAADDSVPANDIAERPVEIAEALPVLLVDGEPGREPLSGETDFLRAALAPAEDDAPAVKASVVKLEALTAESLQGRRVVVLANVDRLTSEQIAALTDFVSEGGGLLIAPGDRVDVSAYNQTLFADGGGLLPAKLGETKGEFARKTAVAHPVPRTFTGPALGPFGAGESPPLAEADLFSYRILSPATNDPPASIIARLDTGDPWAVERQHRKGRVIVMAGPLDAEGGTLPVNPDFVPLIHELIYRLADPASTNRPAKPGEALRIELAEAPRDGVKTARVTRPDGSTFEAPIAVEGAKQRVKLDDTAEPGIYRVNLPGASGGTAFVSVASDPKESEPEPLAKVEADKLAEGWPLAIETTAEALSGRMATSTGGGPKPIWRWLVLAALGGLCMEVCMTRSLVKSRGMTAPEEATT